MAAKLTPKQAAFVREYLVSRNAAQAAARAGYSARTAKSQGQRLLTNVDVREAVQRGEDRLAITVGRQAEDVLKDIQSIGQEARASGDLKTALKSYELEGKHLGMFRDRVELTGSLDLTMLEEARQRVSKLR